ncbi:hypothetical protein GGR54DRAFT_542035 [Hypoxylon sp. NC1633]|nr:hypothetical protein GGR54DRAFT_542035 [Hypoxylon sp. NC1633]
MQWLSCIMGGSCVVLVILGLPKTLGPLLLQARAAKLRKSGANTAARTAFDDRKLLGLMDIVWVYLTRPFVLATEPILVLITIYRSFIYGIMYLIFVSYPIAFREVRHWALGVSALPFLGLMVGIILGAICVVWHTKTKFMATIQANGGKIILEQRLPMMIADGCITGSDTVSWLWE